ncbi:MAG: hypothetical protein JOY96_12545 [Verrucomicrobia bacterium]|nr:hypothetical protein [Verrucomicrobiota bacterium]
MPTLRLSNSNRITGAQTRFWGATNRIIRDNPRRRPKILWSERGDGDYVRVIPIPDDHEEANFVVSEIQRLQVIERAPWTDFAVIFRMNTQSRLIEENLRPLRIPYRVFGGRSYFERREVEGIISYLNCLLNPQDDSSLLRIIIRRLAA